jgi:uncharacterized protein YeaO (DUF488 family)
MKGKLYTSYFAKFKTGIGYKISIARFSPKWLEKEKLICFKNLAPSQQLLNDYKYKGLSWDEYTTRYLEEIGSSKEAQSDIDSICEKLEEGNDITLYCYEKPSDNCHRHILAEIFKVKGYEVNEL